MTDAGVVGNIVTTHWRALPPGEEEKASGATAQACRATRRDRYLHYQAATDQATAAVYRAGDDGGR